MSAEPRPTDVLEELRSGRPESLDKLSALLYTELREIAHRHRRARDDGGTLATTALVHEVYLKLVDQSRAGWRDRAQLGDGYLRRADDRRQKADALETDAHLETLRGALDDYRQCVATFEPILDKGRSRRNRDYCQRHADSIAMTLGEEGDPR